MSKIVLLVEDEDAVRRMTARMLIRSGADVVVEANSTAEATKAIDAADQFDLLVTDNDLGDHGGGPLVGTYFNQKFPEAKRVGYSSTRFPPETVDVWVPKPHTTELQVTVRLLLER